MTMLSNEFIHKKILTAVWDKCRKIDYFLILSLLENADDEIMKELKKFQNDDGGFGHALEPDIRCPFSSVAATDVAIFMLDFVKDEECKEEMIKDIVRYYENTFDPTKKAWEIVPAVVDEYPRAVWWNYESVDSFTYGNPNPEIIGFLYQYRKYLTKIDIIAQVNKVVDYVNSDFANEATMHSIQSVLHFYKRMDKDVRSVVKEKLQRIIDIEIEKSIKQKEAYSFEPYVVGLVDKMLLSNHLNQLDINLDDYLKKIEYGLIEPSWNWYQFDDVFEEVKHEWDGFITFQVVRALRMNRDL